jgi:type VI secretion system secreted protein VgrG
MADRYLLLDTPLSLSPPDLLLASFEGEEVLSRPFNFTIGFWSTKLDISGKDLIGQSVTVTVTTSAGNQRYFNGVVSNLQAGQLDGGSKNRFYRAEIVPTLQLLAETSDCRIFQNMTAPAIVEQLLNDQGITDFRANLTGSYTTREYCVQYRETDLDFISRLLEEEGIFYYFQHASGKHTLVLADAASAYQDCPDSQLIYSSSTSMTTATIRSWDHAFHVLTKKWTLTDYNYETPTTSLLANTSTTSSWGASSSERFDYPGLYQKQADGTTRSKLRMEADEALSETVHAHTLMPSLFPGGKFTVSAHDLSAEVGQGWAIVSVHHKATDDSQINAGGAGRDYGNEILAIPQGTCFRPRRVTPKPYIHGGDLSR